MCFSNCPYEKNGTGETAGECRLRGKVVPEDAHCFEPPEEETLEAQACEQEHNADIAEVR